MLWFASHPYGVAIATISLISSAVGDTLNGWTNSPRFAWPARRGGYILAHSTSLSQGLHFLALRYATLMYRPFEFPQLKLCDWFAPVNFNES